MNQETLILEVPALAHRRAGKHLTCHRVITVRKFFYHQGLSLQVQLRFLDSLLYL